MNPLSHEQVLSRLRQLPSLPAAVTELLTSFDNEDVDIAAIVRLISRDQGLAARVLRVANSSFYGLQSKVASINEAVVVIGFRAVRSMVLAVGVTGLFKVDKCPGFDLRSYLRHGVGVALVARALASHYGRNPEMAFTGGILHDLGQLALAANFPGELSAALAYREQHDCPLVVAERDLLGIDHAAIGGILAENWSFPDTLRAALADHHAPAAATADSLADLIHIADAVSHGLGLAACRHDLVMPVDRTAWQRLGVDAAVLTAILPQVMQDMEETCAALA
ncbi:MAG: HDOD domain-containing protein [Azonexus sp.]|nr:HDOD domain-containing protein [Azonexus sp.]MCK6410835.1 HDOD domain-containing protein [Azonexus sp.]